MIELVHWSTFDFFKTSNLLSLKWVDIVYSAKVMFIFFKEMGVSFIIVLSLTIQPIKVVLNKNKHGDVKGFFFLNNFLKMI